MLLFLGEMMIKSIYVISKPIVCWVFGIKSEAQQLRQRIKIQENQLRQVEAELSQLRSMLIKDEDEYVFV